MTKSEAKKRIEKLKKVIGGYSYRYHVLDDPSVNNEVWDSLKHELKKLEDKNPEFITPDSPTQRVSGKALDKFEKVEHRARMLSLEDAFSEEELLTWQERIQKLVPNQKLDYFSELKIDGFAVSLVYKKGVFVEGSTRGDGKTGENVTQNLKTIASIPLKLETRQKLTSPAIERKTKEAIEKGEIEIRGEVYMTKDAFAKVNRQRRRESQPLYANPRNTAAGSIRQLDPKIAASRNLDFLAYDLVTDLGQKTHQDEHQIVRALGFKTTEEKHCSDLKKVVDFWQAIGRKREKLPYLIDGLVVSINSDSLFKKMGVVGKAPRGAIALKFPGKEATTVVKDIIVQVGRTGALTPVAVLKPVNIEGALVTRATLHNEDEIVRLDVRIGDTVVVQRAGDVIPDIVEVIKKLRSGREKKFKMPKLCPVCGSKVIRPANEAVHRCSNSRCGAQQKKRIIHFVSKKAFNMEGLGPKIIEQLMNQGLIGNPADIFSLKRGDLIPLERFAEKSADNLIAAIDKSKKISLANLIFALGIRHVGEETAISLARHFGSLDKIRKANQEELLRIEDIGEKVAQSIFEWLNNKDNQAYLEKLLKSGLEIAGPKPVAKKLADLTFVLTGELDSMTRDEAKSKIRQLGGDVSGSVSKETDFVVKGESPGSKYGKAKKLGVKIIGEKEFSKMVK